jgi:hypothetical protein
MSRITGSLLQGARQESAINVHIDNIAREALTRKRELLEDSSIDTNRIDLIIRELIEERIRDIYINTNGRLLIHIDDVYLKMSIIDRAQEAAIIEEMYMLTYRRTHTINTSVLRNILEVHRAQTAQQFGITPQEINHELNINRTNRERERSRASVQSAPSVRSAQIVPLRTMTPNDERIQSEKIELEKINNAILNANTNRMKSKKAIIISYINENTPGLNYENLQSIYEDLELYPECKCRDIIMKIYDTLIDLAVNIELKRLYNNINLLNIDELRYHSNRIIYIIINEINKCIKKLKLTDNIDLLKKLIALKTSIGIFKKHKIDFKDYEDKLSKLSDSISLISLTKKDKERELFFQKLDQTYAEYKKDLIKLYNIYYFKDQDDCIEMQKTKLFAKINDMMDTLQKDTERVSPDIVINSLINKSQLAVLFDFWNKYPDKDNLFLRYSKTVKINQYTDNEKTIAFDMGGPMRQFILSIMEEINSSSIFTCLEDDIREEKESYYLNKHFEFSKEFKETILFLNSDVEKDTFKFETHDYKALFFKFFGGFLTFCIINNFTLPKRISSVILSSLIYFNKKLRVYDSSISDSYKLFYLWYDKSDIFYKLGNLLQEDPKIFLWDGWDGKDDYQDDIEYSPEKLREFDAKYKFFTHDIKPHIGDKNKPITGNNIMQFFIDYSKDRFPDNMEKYYIAISEGFNVNLQKCLAENKTPLYVLDAILSKTYTITIEEVEKLKTILSQNMITKIALLADDEKSKTKVINDYFTELLSGKNIIIREKTLTNEEYLEFISKLLIFWSGWNHIMETDSHKYFFIVSGDTTLLPASHTCSFQLDIPPYENKKVFFEKLYISVTMSGEDMNLMGGANENNGRKKHNIKTREYIRKNRTQQMPSNKYYRSKISSKLNKLKKILYKG